MCCGAMMRLEPKVRDERTLEAVLSHAGELLTERMKINADEAMPRYAWKYGKGKRRTIVCNCGAEYEMPDEWARLHDEHALCPACGRIVVVRDAWRGHTALFDRLYLADWRKSTVEPGAVVLVGAYVYRDSRNARPARAEIVIEPDTICMYRYGHGGVCFKCGQDQWYRMRQCNTNAGNGYGGSLRVIPCDEQFHEAIRGTSFERMWKLLRPDVGRYTYADRAPEMEAIARRPFLEYLWRMGQKTLAVQGLERHYAAGIINSRGKTATAVLKMTGEDLREVRDKKIELTEALLVARKRLADAGIHWRMGDIAELNRAVGVILLEDMLEYRQDDKAMRYVLKMARRGEHPSDIRDYWKALHELGQDVRDDALALTNRLTDRHQEAMTQLNALTAQRIANRQATGLDLNNGEVTALGEQFQKALPGLIKRFSYAACGLILRPASGAAELMVESSALNHCVRMYAERYMRGETVICVLRRERAPDVPWHTVEFTPEGKRVQCRGENNQTQVVDAALLASFWAAYGDREERRSAS